MITEPTRICAGPEDDLTALALSGRVLELRPGRYRRGLFLRGAENLVLRRAAGATGEVCFWRAGIHLVGASRVRLEGLTFRQAPASAVCIEGPAREVVLDDCAFLACGMPGGSVTVWLGEHTQACAVRGCRFDTCGLRAPRHDKPSHVHDIAVMCAEQDCTDHVFQGNQIENYGYGLQLGVSGTCQYEGRHRVEGNTVLHPLSDGIHVKQARCVVRGNAVHGAARFAISTRAGFASRIEDNHLTDCQHGIRILGRDHAVVGNHIERSRLYGLLLSPAKTNGDGAGACNTLVEDNLFVDCGGCDPDGLLQPPGAVILSDGVTPQRVGHNRFEGEAAEMAVLPASWQA